MLISLLAAIEAVCAFATQVECDQTAKSVDLLVVGGDEAACAAAIQAARMGVKQVALVSDCAMLGGQYSAQGVGPVDERIRFNGKSADFPRSGLALEITEAIEAYNLKRYALSCPGNCWSATHTIEPRPAAEIFERLVAEAGERLAVYRGNAVKEVIREGNTIVGVRFTGGLTIRAKLTIDASDWGDVIRLGGARYYCGVDPRERFHEPSAPETVGPVERQEMNPITWTLTLHKREGAKPVERPAGYDYHYFEPEEWPKSGLLPGTYPSTVRCTPYIQRRLVDTVNLPLSNAVETIQLNATCMDYALCQYPAHLAKKLRELGAGYDTCNFVELPAAAKALVLDDAKDRALSYLYFLQHDNPATTNLMCGFELTDEFGTPDRLPPKVYVREGCRLAAMTMLTENEVKAQDPQRPHWAKCPDDAAFGFQFHIDFHPTRRSYPSAARPNAWRPKVASRNWNSEANRSFFPYSGFVPETMEGLLGAGKNIGVSSVVQAALRLHPQMVLSGQCAGALAAAALQAQKAPRELVKNPKAVASLQATMVRGVGGKPGVAIWAWQNLKPGDRDFILANLPVRRDLPILAASPANPADFIWKSYPELPAYATTRAAIEPCARKTLSRPHPWLLASAEDFNRMRAEITRNELFASGAKKIFAEADRLIGKEPVQREVIGIRMLGCAWKVERRLLVLSLAYRLTDDRRYLDQAVAELKSATQMIDWNPTHYLDTATMSLGVAIACDWLYEAMDATVREQILDGFMRLAFLHYENDRYWHRIRDNWGQICNAGQVAAALTFLDTEFERSVTLLARAAVDVREAMTAYAPKGAYPEGPGYWNYGTSHNILLIALLESALGSDFGLGEMPGFRQTPEFLELATGTCGKTINFSDSGSGRGEQPCLWYFARKYNRPDLLKCRAEESFVWHVKNSSTIDPLHLLWWYEIPSATTPQLPLAWDSEGKNPFAVHRSSWRKDAVFAALKAGSPAYPHGHMDSGSFWLDMGGLRWIHDLGANDYHRAETNMKGLFSGAQNSDRWNIYRLGTLGHNVLMINGEKQFAKGVAKVVSVSEGPGSEIVVDASENYPMAKSVIRTGQILSATDHYRLRDDLVGLKAGDRVQWSCHVRNTEVAVNDDEVVLTQDGKCLRLTRQTIGGSASAWVVTKDPKGYAWEEDNKGVSRLSFETTVTGMSPLRLTVDFVLDASDR